MALATELVKLPFAEIQKTRKGQVWSWENEDSGVLIGNGQCLSDIQLEMLNRLFVSGVQERGQGYRCKFNSYRYKYIGRKGKEKPIGLKR